ncbi:hypothetical protein E2C01_066124 [Portunus trituberculatus]|uniref:Uncharacterized protein n=1 Tax=Portunus trituberculatus TaxID=210409 RepID=A0A5B7HTN5_PORTR|nr:hypothetical protein [Portunus trituberculatus]
MNKAEVVSVNGCHLPPLLLSVIPIYTLSVGRTRACCRCPLLRPPDSAVGWLSLLTLVTQHNKTKSRVSILRVVVTSEK